MLRVYTYIYILLARTTSSVTMGDEEEAQLESCMDILFWQEVIRSVQGTGAVALRNSQNKE